MNFIKAVYALLSSMRVALFLLCVIAIGCAAATFIENDFGSAAARSAVYNHRWFETALFLLALTIICNMTRFNVWRKMPVFVFHCSILLIMLGAFITRYFGYEGTIHIRNGESSNVILSADSYIKISSSGLHASFPVLLSPISDAKYKFSANLGGGAPIEIKTKGFYQNATEAVVADQNGKAFVSLIVNFGAQPIAVELFEDEIVDLGTAVIGFGDSLVSEKPLIAINKDGDQLTIRAYSDLMRSDMDTKEQVNMRSHTIHPLDTRKLYTTLDGISLVLREHLSSASRKVVKAEQKTGISAVVIEATHKGDTKEVTALGGSGMAGRGEEIELAGRSFTIAYGSEAIELPFALKLDKFALERYPGSQSPSSYESYVTLVDDDIVEKHRIYMNNILKYKGYRFYQFSYDRDEQGTVLSVSKDPGIWLTYLGYFLLSIGFFAAFFSPQSRFRWLSGEIEKRRLRLGAVAAVCVMATALPSAAEAIESAGGNQTAEPTGILGIVESAHANRFSQLLVQDNSGRIKPIDTLSIEVLNKLTGKSTLKTLSANQVFLGMMSAPHGWQQVKMIRIGHSEIARLIGLEADAKEAAFADFFAQESNNGGDFSYKLDALINEAVRARASDRTQLQKELIKIDERVNIAYMVYQSTLLRIIPIKNDPSFTWIAPTQIVQ
ncbi:MAG: cytochrome c biogenesis protein ResB, partial [Helicobacteraceae bacterium]|nr:cytochrome c biogenesis protein ResB [Helicobacteraceae bacterium]